MSLTLYYHPLSSFCWKVLVALYENGTPFAPQSVNLGNPDERAALLKLWPIGKFPVLRDDATDLVLPESTVIIDYLDRKFPGLTRFIPADPDMALQTRLRDRFYDLYVHLQVQKIVGDRLRPDGSKDAFGVAQAKAQLQTCYGMIDAQMSDSTWAMGETFSLADCSALPALFYGSKVLPFDAHPHVVAYFERLMARPSVMQVVKQAEPYFHMFPGEG